MNFFRALAQQLFGMKKGYSVYRQVITAGQAVAPLAVPLVQQYLASRGLPITPQGALEALAAKAASSSPLAADLTAALQAYVAGQIAPATNGGTGS